jgi:mono/diheme cytochrome c family protein
MRAGKETIMGFRYGRVFTAMAPALVIAGSAFAADAKHGAVIAKRWCAACHVVSSEQKSGSADVPPFADIARRRTDSNALAAFLVDPHPKMPDMHLTRREIEDIVAYIRSLNPAATPPTPDGKDVELPKKG